MTHSLTHIVPQVGRTQEEPKIAWFAIAIAPEVNVKIVRNRALVRPLVPLSHGATNRIGYSEVCETSAREMPPKTGSPAVRSIVSEHSPDALDATASSSAVLSKQVVDLARQDSRM